MNKPILMIISLLFISCINCLGQQKNQNDLSDYQLKGKVKSLRSVPYHVISRNGKLQKGMIYDELSVSVQYDIILKFNEHENITQDGYTFGGKTEYTNSTYDSNNNLIKRIDKSFSLWPETLYIYDSLGNKIEEQRLKTDGRVSSKKIFKYDNKGCKVTDYSEYNDGKEHFKHTYKYNKKGVCTQEDHYGQDGRLESKWFYKYNSLGQRISTSVFDSAGSLQRNGYLNIMQMNMFLKIVFTILELIRLMLSGYLATTNKIQELKWVSMTLL